jgi:hypothetical protein
MKKVISYSLWGNNKFYTVNCIRNADLALELFPGWICRVYIAPTVPLAIVEDLKKRSNVELIEMTEDVSWNGMFWRFYAAGDSTVDVMISRDCDSLLNTRDKAAVDEWLASDKDFHIMRDNSAHTTMILGGMWGARNGIVGNIVGLINAYSRKETNNRKNIDQEFLADIVYPLVIDRALVHDPLRRYGHGKEFPIPRNLPWYEDTLNGEWRGCEWIGDDNDYIGKVAAGGCTHNEYHKNFDDERYTLMPQSNPLKKTENGMNRIVVVSTNNNPNYYFYAPYVKKAWNSLGWKVCVMITHDVDPSQIDGDYIITIPNIEGIRLETQAQAGRLYAANHLPADSYLMTSDMDLIPLSDYWNPEANRISVYGFDLTDYTTYPMAYIGMSCAKWKSVMRLTGDTISDFIRDAQDTKVAYSSDWEKWWSFDQDLITKRLHVFKTGIQFINRGRASGSVYATGRIDRGTGMQPVSEPWIDAHCDNSDPRNPEKLERFLKIFNQVYP